MIEFISLSVRNILTYVLYCFLLFVFSFFFILYFNIAAVYYMFFFFFQAEDGIRDLTVTGVQTCALPILKLPCARRATSTGGCAISRSSRSPCSPAPPPRWRACVPSRTTWTRAGSPRS